MSGTQSSPETVHIIGAGLAGSEAAWQVAERGICVILHEMRPARMTEAHRTDGFAELVCSNSFRSDDAVNNAVGLLHAEMRRLNSLIMRAADTNQVPAGGALAVDREGFSADVTKALHDHPLIEIERGEIAGLPPSDWTNVIVATGPLTSAPLADSIRELTDEDALAFFDAIAPIVHKDTIDMSVAWLQSRYDKAGPGGSGADYINCPMTEEQYGAFVDALLAGEKTEFHDWEANTPYFDGCLPIEVMAVRGRETLRHGPMKPVGLTDPHNPTVKPYAIVQLRQDNKLGTLYNMVGFQTKLKYGAQQRIFRTIPGLENAESQHLPEFAKAARQPIATAGAAAVTLCRPDDRLRGLCGIREHRADCRALCGDGCAREADSCSATDHSVGRPARPYHRRPYRNHRAGPPLISTNEHQFRAVSAACCVSNQKTRRHTVARQRKGTRKKAGDQRTRADRSRPLDRR
jgi:methylenetetrahydrofolate--tRNA-(uracil-5-)-methyltransferase